MVKFKMTKLSHEMLTTTATIMPDLDNDNWYNQQLVKKIISVVKKKDRAENLCYFLE